MQEKLNNIAEIIKTVERNYETEIVQISAIMNLRIRTEYPKNHPQVKQMAKLMAEIRALNSKQLGISKSIFENFQSEMGSYAKIRQEGFNQGYESAKKNVIQSKNKEFSKIEKLRDSQISDLKTELQKVSKELEGRNLELSCLDTKIQNELQKNELLMKENSNLKKLMRDIQDSFTTKISQTIKEITMGFNSEKGKFLDKIGELKTQVKLTNEQKADFYSKWVNDQKLVDQEKQKLVIFRREAEKLQKQANEAYQEEMQSLKDSYEQFITKLKKEHNKQQAKPKNGLGQALALTGGEIQSKEQNLASSESLIQVDLNETMRTVETVDKSSSDLLQQISEMEETHNEEIDQFRGMMKQLKSSYDSREKMYLSKLKKLKVDSELNQEELQGEIESLSRQVNILKKLKTQ